MFLREDVIIEEPFPKTADCRKRCDRNVSNAFLLLVFFHKQNFRKHITRRVDFSLIGVRCRMWKSISTYNSKDIDSKINK